MDEKAAFLRASWANVLANAVKLVVEGGVGLLFGSFALVADAANSLGDLLASLGILTWGRLTYVGPDSTHPHGHERLEPLVAFLVGLLLGGFALRLLYGVAITLVAGPTGTFAVPLVVALGIAIAVKAAAYWYTDHVNSRLDSAGLRALKADARTDLYASTAAVIGVVGFATGIPALDPVAGGLVSVLILRESVGIVRENLGYLTGAAPPKATCERIRTTVLDTPCVRSLDGFRAHYVGQDIEVEVEASIDGDLPFEDAHDVETSLEAEIGAIDAVHHVHVRLSPIE